MKIQAFGKWRMVRAGFASQLIMISADIRELFSIGSVYSGIERLRQKPSWIRPDVE
jgi:hypothetical protein